jgi:hypothetical protein
MASNIILNSCRTQHFTLYLQYTRHNERIHFGDQQRRLTGGCNLLRRCQQTEATWKQAVTTRKAVLTLTQHQKQYSNNVISGFHGRGYEDNDTTGCNNVTSFRLVNIKPKITYFPSWSSSTRHSEFKSSCTWRFLYAWCRRTPETVRSWQRCCRPVVVISVILKGTHLVSNLTFSQSICWRFKPSGMVRRIH